MYILIEELIVLYINNSVQNTCNILPEIFLADAFRYASIHKCP